MYRLFACLKAAAFLAAVLIVTCSPAGAQLTSDGRYKGPLHQLADPPSNPSVRAINSASFGAQRQGASLGGDYGDSYGGGETFSGTPVGYWALSDVLSGKYAIAFARTHEFPRVMFFDLNAGARFVLYRNTPDYYPSATFWRAPALFFGQQFQALGTSVTSVSARAPGSSATAVRVTIHEGDINGHQIGPARVLVTNFADDNMASWSAGEVPTVPGHYYTAKFMNADDEFGPKSLQLFYAPGRCLMGDAYYGGKSWVADPTTQQPVEVAEPIKTVIGMDTDGITSTVYTSTAYQGLYEGPTRAADVNAGMCGQTFVAKGTSVLAADFRIWNPCYIGGSRTFPDMQVAVFQGPGTDGLGVNQIGPTKYARTGNGGEASGRTIATWYPGEVPVTAGQSYYLRITPVPGALCGFFQIWVTTEDEYSGGQAFLGTGFPLSPQPYDLSCMILEETSAGSAMMAKVPLTNKSGVTYSSPECTVRNPTTALIEWATPGTSSTGKVEFGSQLPYTQTVQDTNASTVHSVTLAGLKPATLYHCRITASAPGKRDAISKDFAFVTEAETPNLLTNGGFEAGNLTGWTRWGDQLPGLRSDEFIGGIRRHTGTYYVGGAWNSCCTNPSSDGGVYQKVAVAPNQPVTLRAWLYTYQGDPSQDPKFDAAYDMMCLGRIGIDPTGGTTPTSPNIVWSMPTSGQDWYDPNFAGKYVDLALTVEPQAAEITVFAEAGQLRLPGQAKPSQIGYTAYAWDDFYLSQSAVTQVEHIGDVAALPDGLFIEAAGLIVTAHPLDAGAHYIQSSDRSSGMRVESDDFLMRGTAVTVRGRLATKPSGERYLADATFPVQAYQGEATPMFARNAQIGNLKAGLRNVGLLMRTAGTVKSAGSGYVMISDGSQADGLKVDLSSAGGSYTAGQVLSIVGVVQLEGGSASSATALLRARDAADITVVN